MHFLVVFLPKMQHQLNPDSGERGAGILKLSTEERQDRVREVFSFPFRRSQERKFLSPKC